MVSLSAYARTCAGTGFGTLPYAGQLAFRAHEPSDKVANTVPKISSFFMNAFVVCIRMRVSLINELTWVNRTRNVPFISSLFER